jgi:NAD-dependent dihydropyrimidine dehydrogenase PreA subunit
MKGIILYYSNTGNTLLASRYVVHKLPGVDFDFCDIKQQKRFDLDQYDIAGFATFTDAWEPPVLFVNFIQQLPEQNRKPAFLLNTYGFLSGKTLKSLNQYVTARGFLVIGGHSLNTPENFPPMHRVGLGGTGHPGKRKIAKFNEFIDRLRQHIHTIKNNGEIYPEKIRIGIINTLLPRFPQEMIQPVMGEKKVDKELCTECGVCGKICPRGAITLNPKPVFDNGKCHYCWTCYNRCPQKALYTTTFRGKYHYPGPNDLLKEKLKRV